MNEAAYRFEFVLTKAELKEVLGTSRNALRRLARPRLIRLVMVLLLLPAAGLFGFMMAPISLGHLSFDHRMSVAALCFFAAMAGVAAERVAVLLSFRLMSRPYKLRAASSRALSVGVAGVEEDVSGFRLGMDWATAQIVRGRSTIIFLAPGGEWLALPRRLLPDGGKPLEREIAVWHTMS